jgi:hypothetical protein
MRHPNLVWQVRSGNGTVVSCFLAPSGLIHAVIRIVDDVVAEVEEFDDLETAQERVRALYADTAGSATSAG